MVQVEKNCATNNRIKQYRKRLLSIFVTFSNVAIIVVIRSNSRTSAQISFPAIQSFYISFVFPSRRPTCTSTKLLPADIHVTYRKIQESGKIIRGITKRGIHIRYQSHRVSMKTPPNYNNPHPRLTDTNKQTRKGWRRGEGRPEEHSDYTQ